MKIIRPKPALFIMLAVAKAMFVAGFIFMYVTSGWSWTTIGFAAMTLIAALGFVELGTTRVILLDDSVEMGSIWKRRSLRRDEIKRVTWEKGAGVAFELNQGGWAKLPELGFNSQGLTNTMRAWLNRAGS